MNRRDGFTLIELLVVIAIIAILAAILFPVMTSAKEQANKTRCINNMKQIAAGLMLYADNFSGALPIAWDPETNWNDWDGKTFRWRIMKYLKNKNVLICPAKNHKYVRSTVGHYGMNTYLCMNENGSYFPSGVYSKPYVRILSSIPFPGQTILIAENTDGDWSAEPWDNSATGEDAGKFWPYHSGGNNKGGVFSFCDGHCAFMSVLKTEERDYYYWRISKITNAKN